MIARFWLGLTIVLGAAGCVGTADLGGEDIVTVEDLREACESEEPQDVELEVFFADPQQLCPFDEDDNLPREEGAMTARIEQVASVVLPEGGVACDLAFDFQGIDPSTEQIMVYDDHFLLTFNDVVLASNNAQIAEALPADEDGLRIYDWADIVGIQFEFFETPNYCLGEDEGLSDCTIPEPEDPGPISLSFEGDLVDLLSLRALEQQRYDFGFVTTGDNDDSDCSHEDFGFVVTAPVVFP
ncbi:MAG: hypothetical protein GY898_16030 [Proteobacteria bacterium]|nr:hypothetical protein [Pseudomonadota bacterium]